MSRVIDESRSDGIVTLVTPPGRGAVATIVHRGDPQVFDADPRLCAAANGMDISAQPLNRVCFCWWGVDVSEEVVLCRTSAGVTEIHCHGGAAAGRRILDDLERTGCRIVDWQELSASISHQIEAQCTLALTQATTLRTARILLEQQSGVLRLALEGMLASAPDVVAARAEEILRWSRFGLHLTRPWKVVLCGLPNVGKSSLINALLGYSRSIVFDQPGTTRDVVTGQTALEGWPVELSDTAGLRGIADDLEAAGIDRARRTAAAADCLVLVLDRSRPLHADDLTLMDQFPDAIRVANKSDLAGAWQAADVLAVVASAVSKSGIDALCAEIVRRLVPRVPAPGTPLPVTQRQVDALCGIHQRALAGDSHGVRAAIDACLA